MALDEEQLALLNDVCEAFEAWGASARPTPGQTIEQQRNFSVSSFQYLCQFIGLEVPKEEDVRVAAWKLWPSR